MTSTTPPEVPSATRNDLGPLTTAFTPPSECFQTIAYANPSTSAAEMGNIYPYGGKCGPEVSNGFDLKCFPNRYTLLDEGKPSGALAAYSPAFRCPQGWSTAFQISKDPQGFSTIINLPSNIALEPLAAWLEPDEELTACCPSGAPLSFKEDGDLSEPRCGTMLQAGSMVAAKVFPNQELCNAKMQNVVLAAEHPQVQLVPIHLVKRSTDSERHVPFENLMRRLDDSSSDNSTTNGTSEGSPTGGFTGTGGNTSPDGSQSSDSSGGPSSTGLSTGAKIGIGVGVGLGGLLILAAIVATVVFFLMRRRKRTANAWPGNASMNINPTGPTDPSWASPQNPPAVADGGAWQQPQGIITRPAPVHSDWRELHGDSSKPAPINDDWRELPSGEKPVDNTTQSPNASEMPINYSSSFNSNQELDSQTATLTTNSQLPVTSSPYAAELEGSTRGQQGN